MSAEYYGLTNAQLALLLQAQSVLSLLGKLSNDVVSTARIHADEVAAVAAHASERMQNVLTDLGSPTQPMFYVNTTEGYDHAR